MASKNYYSLFYCTKYKALTVQSCFVIYLQVRLVLLARNTRLFDLALYTKEAFYLQLAIFGVCLC